MQRKRLTGLILFISFFITQTGYSQNNIIQLNLIPQPDSVTVHEGEFVINAQTTIKSNDYFCGNYLKEKLEHALKNKIQLSINEKDNSSLLNIENNYIIINITPSLNLNKEEYSLSVNNKGIYITASAQAGAFYGVQTLLQLLPPTIYGDPTGFEKWSVPAVEISDNPLFAYRGFMLDVSRTFFDIGVLYNYVDWLSYHKMNKFHLHLADDNGWRIEIKKYPKLTREGAWRGEGEILPATFGSGDKRYGGFYTQKQLKALIKYAAERNIEIIPEIDLPGHSKALAACYPDVLCKTTKEFASVQGESGNVLCVGNENNYKMLDNIFKEIAAIFPSEYIHIGGDEVNMENWKDCPLCIKLMKEKEMTKPEQLQNYFVRRLETIIEKHGKKMAGWDEIIEGGELHPQTRVYAWRDIKTGLRSAEKGQPTIMQPAQYFYVDMKQSPVERGHNWAAIVTLEKLYSFNTKNLNKNIIGVQAGLWTELLNRPKRFIEYQTFPRLSALAEVGWSDNDHRVWKDFYFRLTKTHYERLSNMGIAFRLPMPDVIYENNKLKVTLPYNWAIVRYTSDRTEPNQSSPVYSGEINTDSPENYRFATFYGDYDKSITVGAKNVELHHYLTPKTTVSTNLQYNSDKQLGNLTDYNFNTYFRSKGKAKAGDYMLYTFAEPVECSSVTIETGIPNIDFYGITKGHIEYSYDGIIWHKGDEFYEHRAILSPKQAIKSIKLAIDGTNDGPTSLCLQDLKIEGGERFRIKCDINGVEKGDTLRFSKVTLPGWNTTPAFDIIAGENGYMDYNGYHTHSQLYIAQYHPIKGEVVPSDRGGQTILITSGEYILKGTKEYLYYMSINGGLYDNSLNEIISKKNSLDMKRGELMRKIKEYLKLKDTIVAQTFINEFNNFHRTYASDYSAIQKLMQNYNAQHGNEYSACELAQSSYKPYKLLNEEYNRLSDVGKKSYYGQFVENLLSKMKIVESGNIAPDMILVTKEGKEVKISDFKGKYLLIYHYGLCPGSIQLDPVIQELYLKNRGKMEVIGITDAIKTIQDVVKGIKGEDKQRIEKLLNHPWQYDIDLSCHNEINKNIKEKFFIVGLPFLILISPEGIIIDRSIGNSVLDSVKKVLK